MFFSPVGEKDFTRTRYTRLSRLCDDVILVKVPSDPESHGKQKPTAVETPRKVLTTYIHALIPI